MASSDAPTRNELCSFCISLNISAQKFTLSNLESNQEFDDKGLEPMNIGFLDNFYRRRHQCPFCQLIYEATHHENAEGVGHDGLDKNGNRVSCWMDWHLDGRHTDSQSAGKHTPAGALTRRLRLYSKTSDFQACYLVPLRRKSRMETPSFQARAFPAEQADITQLQRWLHLCEDNHVKCSTPASQHEISIKLRVVDVLLMCIVEIEPTQRYLTLSYCWGAKQFLTLLSYRYNSFTQPHAFTEESLPQTIFQALRLVSALGERYIWIDSLCIIQDVKEDWEKIAPLMDRIYGNSILTICAASGNNTDFGLPGALKGSRSLNQSLQNCGGLNLVPFKSLENRIEASPWNARAWIFQERMLSRRCLIFVDDRVFFQCQSATWCEELECENSKSFWTLDMLHSPMNLFNENPLRRYSRSVELYSGRHLTFESDRLVAFEGIAQSIAEAFHPVTVEPLPSFRFGLPAWYFDWALLWDLKSPEELIERPREDFHSSRLQSQIHLPSWSWCGWRGTSEWRMSATSTVLLNLHEWLMVRTWIVWYLGSDTGHKLVFQVDQAEKPSVRGRWMGYAINTLTVTEVNEPAIYDAYGRKLSSKIALPSQPTHPPREGHLHFFTWSAFFTLSRKSKSENSFKSNLHSGLHRFGIVDSRGDWCGTIILNEKYFHDVGGAFEFIAISEARDFAMEEYDSWTYYVPGEREEAEWYLYYALMIKWNEDKTVAKRLGLAKIYKAAFQSGSLEPGFCWKEITMG